MLKIKYLCAEMMYVDDHLWDFDLATALQEISAQRREQALRYRHELGQRQCVLAYLLLKRALREEFGITDNPVFIYGEHGKPVLADYPDIHFSLSHCREAVACVVGSRPVGIDVESVRPLKESLVRYTMSETEQQKIFGAENPALMFTRLWTMKEASLKLTGEGLRDHLSTVLEGCELGFETFVSTGERYVCTIAK